MSPASPPAIRTIEEMLPHRDWKIGTRAGAPHYLTLHYNGPPVANRTPKGELAQLSGDANWHMRPGGVGAVNGADGLQYHYAVISDGTIYQCRDDTDVLWHCGNAVGNAQSLSIQVPVGGKQDATVAQWAGVTLLFDWLRGRYAIPVDRVMGHMEWKSTDCPGPKLMPRLTAWRKASPATRAQVRGVTRLDTAVYEAPSSTAPIAMGGAAHLGVGLVMDFDSILVGAPTLGDARWMHRADGLGFVPVGALTIALV